MKKDKFIKRNELVSLKGNTLSIYARKTLDYIYKNAIEVYKVNKNKGIFELDIVLLKKEIGMNRTSDYSQIIKELNEINNLNFETYDNKYYSKIPILAGFQVLENGILRVALSPFLIEMIFDETNPYYHIADFMEYKSLKSKYTKIILDLYNRYKPTEIPKMTKEEFQEILNYSPKYRNNDIKKNVLEQAQKELKKHNDLILEWEFFPNARKWTEIKLHIKKVQLEKKNDKIIAKTVKKGLGEKELREEQTNIVKNETILNPIEEVILEKISKEQYENLYEQHLKKLKTEHNPFVRMAFDIINKNKYEVIENEKEQYVQTKIYTVEDIPEEKLLSKNGKKLVGMAKINKINKILEEMNS